MLEKKERLSISLGQKYLRKKINSLGKISRTYEHPDKTRNKAGEVENAIRPISMKERSQVGWGDKVIRKGYFLEKNYDSYGE